MEDLRTLSIDIRGPEPQIWTEESAGAKKVSRAHPRETSTLRMRSQRRCHSIDKHVLVAASSLDALLEEVSRIPGGRIWGRKEGFSPDTAVSRGFSVRLFYTIGPKNTPGSAIYHPGMAYQERDLEDSIPHGAHEAGFEVLPYFTPVVPLGYRPG